MVSRTDTNSVRPLRPVDPISPAVSRTDATCENVNRLTQIALGTEMRAKVLSALNDGSYLVKVGDASVRMALPMGTQVGDVLNMTLSGKQPKLIFLLGAGTGGANASLSITGRLIDQLLRAAKQNGAPTTVSGSAPLVSSTELQNPEQIAEALRNALTRSGLFYESHLQSWAQGNRTLSELLLEPQAHFRASINQNTMLSGEGRSGTANASAEAERTSGSLTDMSRLAQAQVAKQAGTEAVAITQAQKTASSLDSEQARMVGLQLHTLEQHQVRWQGELLPGQPFEWELNEDGAHNEPDEQGQASWTSVVRFELPTLGHVTATIRLTGELVQMQIRTPNAVSASLMRAHGDDLAHALEAAGSHFEGLTVIQDAKN